MRGARHDRKYFYYPRATNMPLAAVAWVFWQPAVTRRTASTGAATNTPTPSTTGEHRGDCKLIEGGNVTVVQGTKPNARLAAELAWPRRPVVCSPLIRVIRKRSKDSGCTPDSGSPSSKRPKLRQAELLREYNNGEPEKQGPDEPQPPEVPGPRGGAQGQHGSNESDIAGIRRELRTFSASKWLLNQACFVLPWWFIPSPFQSFDLLATLVAVVRNDGAVLFANAALEDAWARHGERLRALARRQLYRACIC
jgi:hypothetical protein